MKGSMHQLLMENLTRQPELRSFLLKQNCSLSVWKSSGFRLLGFGSFTVCWRFGFQKEVGTGSFLLR